MSNRNKNKNNSRFKNQEKQKSVEYQDYDLARSFSKVRQYSRHTRKNLAIDGTCSDEEQANYSQRGLVSSNSSQYEEKTTGAPSWDRYDRLEDKFSSFSDKNENDHTNLRMELERKIEKVSDDVKEELKELRQNVEKKLPKQWYVWTIIGLVAIVSLIWALSYREIVKIPNDVKEQEYKIDKLENELKQMLMHKDTTKSNQHIR